jgi:hypothetical protein
MNVVKGEIAMKIPQGHCCSCFKANPEKHFTEYTTKKQGGRRYTHKLQVPLCADCHKRVWLGVLLKVVLSIIGLGLVMLAAYGMLVLRVPSWLMTILLPIGAIAAVALPVNIIDRRLNVHFVDVIINPGLGTHIKFLHPEYQKLFLQANPSLSLLNRLAASPAPLPTQIKK